MVQLTLTQAIEQYNRYMRAVGRSQHTISDYNLTYHRLSQFFPHDPLITNLTIANIESFLDHLRNHKITPAGIAPRPPRKLSDKTIQNIHTALSSLWTWAIERQFTDNHIVRAIKVKNPDPPPIEVFTEDEIQILLKTCAYSAPWATRPNTRHKVARSLMLRDQAIILFLLDTGARASEACGLILEDVSFEDRTAFIKATDAKNSKARTVKFGRRAALSLLDYAATRPDTIPNDPLFTTTTRKGIFTEEHFERRAFGAHLRRLGDRAGVENVYPHRFRHTFATQFLRNGGDPYILKELLGHTSLEMVYRYVHFVQSDIAAAHRRASPGDNWKLKLNK